MGNMTIESLQEALAVLLKRNKYLVAVDKLKKMYGLRNLTVRNMGEIVNFKENK